MFDCNPVNTPMERGTKLSKFDDGEEVDFTLFKSLIGSLRYLTCTRSDILFPVGVLSRFMEAPTSTPLTVAKRILCYLKFYVFQQIKHKFSSKGTNNDNFHDIVSELLHLIFTFVKRKT